MLDNKRAYKEFYSFGKKMKILLSMRSMSELMWLVNATFSVYKNMFRKMLGRTA